MHVICVRFKLIRDKSLPCIGRLDISPNYGECYMTLTPLYCPEYCALCPGQENLLSDFAIDVFIYLLSTISMAKLPFAQNSYLIV